MVHPFCQYARAQIKCVLNARGESLRWLSKQTKIEYHRIYRIDSGDMKTLSYFDAKKLLGFLEPETAEGTLKQFYPAETHHLPKQPSVDMNEVQDRLLNFTLQNQIRWTIFLHIATKQGSTRAEIKDKFGTSGLEVVGDLIDAGVLSLDDDQMLISNINRERTPSEQTLVMEAHMHLSLLNFDNPGTYLRNEQQRYNANGRAAVYKLFQELKERIQRIDEDPRFAGDQLYIYTVALGSLSGGENHEK